MTRENLVHLGRSGPGLKLLRIGNECVAEQIKGWLSNLAGGTRLNPPAGLFPGAYD